MAGNAVPLEPEAVDQWVAELACLEYTTLVLADDEVAFLKERGDGGGGSEDTVMGIKPRLFAVVSNSVEHCIAEFEERARAVVNDEPPPSAQLRHCLKDGTEVHVFDVKSLLKGLEKGDPRLVDLVEGLDYKYPSGVLDPSVHDPVNTSHGEPFRVHFESEQWRRLRTLVSAGTGVLHQLNYAQCCIGFSQGLVSSKKVQAQTDRTTRERHVQLMIHRISRVCPAVQDADAAASNLSTTTASTVVRDSDSDSSSLMERLSQCEQDVRRLSKHQGKVAGRNLCAVRPETLSAIQAWVVEQCNSECDAWARMASPPSPPPNAAAATDISDTHELVKFLGTTVLFRLVAAACNLARTHIVE